ncbi:hypothetical protein CTAYLR_007153 [Chrysophaeum taylorii]|uniref:Uncharacterized protein n=1 Tax=Chrysophaeum taylorii TaxID=2483200 RepID=A0AAD7UKK4_9STRA|nr:hypothetical protein CTAYLR_007153 [Chrysophaeum taylorii]
MLFGTWDDQARAAYLTGFEKRKRERRIRGHAHQALKARKARLEARAERRASRRYRTPPATIVVKEEKEAPTTVRYDDSEVMSLWGTEVTVTTTLGLEDAAAPKKKEQREGVDEAQLRAGTLEAMCAKVKGSLLGGRADSKAKRRRDTRNAAKAGKTLGPPTTREEKKKKKGRHR